MTGYDICILGRSRVYRLDHSRTVLDEEILQGPDIEQIHPCHRELLSGCPHIIKSLLHDRHLAGFRRFVNDHLFPCLKKISEDVAFSLSADEVLAGHILVINERSIHISAVLYHSKNRINIQDMQQKCYKLSSFSLRYVLKITLPFRKQTIYNRIF